MHLHYPVDSCYGRGWDDRMQRYCYDFLKFRRIFLDNLTYLGFSDLTELLQRYSFRNLTFLGF